MRQSEAVVASPWLGVGGVGVQVPVTFRPWRDGGRGPRAGLRLLEKVEATLAARVCSASGTWATSLASGVPLCLW